MINKNRYYLIILLHCTLTLLVQPLFPFGPPPFCVVPPLFPFVPCLCGLLLPLFLFVLPLVPLYHVYFVLYHIFFIFVPPLFSFVPPIFRFVPSNEISLFLSYFFKICLLFLSLYTGWFKITVIHDVLHQWFLLFSPPNPILK